MSRGRESVVNGATLMLCAVALVVGSTTAVLLTRDAMPGSLAATSPPTTLALVGEKMRDTRSVELEIEQGGAVELRSPATGTLSQLSCAPGQLVKSGASTMAIDGVARANLHTTVPLWRDLAFGDEGPDVVALQEELARLGYEPSDTGRFDWATWTAFDTLIESIGSNARYGHMTRASLVWLPRRELVAASCPVALGHQVTEAYPLLTSAPPVLAARVSSYPLDLIPGPRVVRIGDTAVRVDDSGVITAPADLAALAGTQSYRKHAASPDSSPVTGELELRKPLTVYPIAPGALTTTGASAGCVTSAGKQHPVRIVGSRLGRTFVTFEGAPPERIDASPKDGSTCA